MKKISQRRAGRDLKSGGHKIGGHQRAGEELQARYQELQTIQEISQIILMSPDLKTSLAKVLEKTLAVVSLDLGNIRLLDAGADSLKPALGLGYRDPGNIDSHRKNVGDFSSAKSFRQMMSEKAPQVEEDVQECDGLRTLKREGIHAAVMIPVRTDTEMIGVLQVGSRKPRKFKPAEIHLLETIGSQIGLAVQKARLAEATQRHLERLRALHEIGLAVSSILDLPAVLNLLMEKLNIFLPDPSVMIWLRDKRSGLLERAACGNLDVREWNERERGMPSLVKAAIEGKAPVVVRDVQNDPRTLDNDFYRRHGLVSYLGIPLIVKDEVLGVLVFLAREEHIFAVEEVEFLSALAGQAAVAIHNSQLHEQSKRQAADLEKANEDLKRKEEIQALLKELSQDITLLDTDNLLKKLTQKIRETFKVDISDARIMVKGNWSLLGSSGIEPERLRGGTGGGQGRSRWIMENRRPLIITDINKTPQLSAQQRLRKIGIRSYLAVPIYARGGEGIGILRALTYQPREFTQEEVDLLQQMANGAGIALENAQLLEQTKKQAVEMEKMNRIQADFTAMVAHDLRSPLTTILSAAAFLKDGLVGPVNEEQHSWLDKIEAHSRNLATFVNDFLDLAKIESGHIDLAKEEIDLDRLIGNSLDNYLPLTRGKKISVTKRVNPALPRIHADPRRLDQIFSNLLSNAIKFTGEGGKSRSAPDR